MKLDHVIMTFMGGASNRKTRVTLLYKRPPGREQSHRMVQLSIPGDNIVEINRVIDENRAKVEGKHGEKR